MVRSNEMTIDCLSALEELVKFELPNYGKITPQLRWVLMNSHCHSFALAIHRLTSWPLVGKVTNGEIEHVLCQMPDGRLLDAEVAMKYPEEPFSLNSDPGFRLLPPDFEFLAEDGWLRSVEDVLNPFVKRLRKTVADIAAVEQSGFPHSNSSLCGRTRH